VAPRGVPLSLSSTLSGRSLEAEMLATPSFPECRLDDWSQVVRRAARHNI
jgi:hypothetical protein